jgi:hypothetical protein
MLAHGPALDLPQPAAVARVAGAPPRDPAPARKAAEHRDRRRCGLHSAAFAADTSVNPYPTVSSTRCSGKVREDRSVRNPADSRVVAPASGKDTSKP